MADEEGQADASHQQTEGSAGILRYDRDELLRLQHRALGEVQQDEGWMQHLQGLDPEVADELQELQAVPEISPSRRRSKNSEKRLRSKARREALKAVSMNSLGSDKDEHQEDSDFFQDSSDARVNENSVRRRPGGKGSRNYESFYDEDLPEVESFQPQAFAVEGEPDFESGEPVDGWEYLRRVRYEAVRCPKVVVADIDPAKFVSEQTPYMPGIPDIPECPLHLRPSKEWEEQHLGDFAVLRMALSNIRAPPTAERIPSLRNKVAWEMRCFGSITSALDEESKELDTVTTKELPTELENEECIVEAKTPAMESADSSKIDSECVAIESRSKHFNDEKELLEPFIELVETQIEPLLNAGSIESSYVIHLGLITDYVPNDGPGDLFNESVYLISGEPAEAHDDTEVRKSSSSIGIADPEHDLGQGAMLLDSQRANLMELGHVEEDSSFEMIDHFEHLTIGDPLLQPDDKEDLELFTAIGVQGTRPSTRGLEDPENAMQSTLSPTYELVEGEDDHLETADFMASLGGEGWALDEGEFGEFYSGSNSRFDSLTIGDPGVFKGEEIPPSFSDVDMPEIDDVDLPTADFTDSLIGLEIFRSGNILLDGPEESLDASDHITEFRIDEPVEELFNKVFQLVGVSQLPFIHLLLLLDEVSRAALFRHHVSWLGNVDGLPKDRALWLLALSAVVDVPLDSQTSAAFRAMLRYCSGVRAKQTIADEDLYLLNLLITVAGVYFGQAETSIP